MAVLVTCALAVLLLGGLLLLRLEWRRYRADRAPAPPPTPEEAALDRWNAGVVMLVAGLSVVGAIIAFWASSQFSSASGLSQQARPGGHPIPDGQGRAGRLRRLRGPSQRALPGAHRGRERPLQPSRLGLGRGGPALARSLEAMARVEGAQERARSLGSCATGLPVGEPAGRSCTTRSGCGPARWSRPACSPARTPRRCAPWTPPTPTPSRRAPPPTAPGAGGRDGRRLRDRGRFLPHPLVPGAGATAGHAR